MPRRARISKQAAHQLRGISNKSQRKTHSGRRVLKTGSPETIGAGVQHGFHAWHCVPHETLAVVRSLFTYSNFDSSFLMLCRQYCNYILKLAKM